MKLSIIILSYNTRDLTLAAAESAWRDIQASPSLRHQAELIIVDNNSTDDSVSALKQAFRHHDRVHILVTKENKGFAAGNNSGIKQAQGEYVLLLNSDTLTNTGAFETMVKLMDDHPVTELTAQSQNQPNRLDRLGILAAGLLNPDGTHQPQGGSFPSLITLINHWLLLDDIPIIGRWLPSTQHTGRRSDLTDLTWPLVKQDWVGGTALLIRREVIDEIGLLDEHIFMYGEDIEYCLRAAHHHWDVAWTPRALITHLGSASAGSARAITGEAKGYLYIWAKHFPLWQFGLVRGVIRVGCLLRAVLFGTMVSYRSRAAVYKQLWHEL